MRDGGKYESENDDHVGAEITMDTSGKFLWRYWNLNRDEMPLMSRCFNCEMIIIEKVMAIGFINNGEY